MVEMADVVRSELSYAQHEHQEVRTGIDQIHKAAAALGWTSNQQAANDIRRVRDWFQGVLVPHAAWEDAVIYPEIERLTHTEWSVKQMRYEHYQIERAAAALNDDIEALQEPVTHQEASEIRGHLLGLEALLRAHLEREDLFILPLLEPDLIAPRPSH